MYWVVAALAISAPPLLAISAPPLLAVSVQRSPEVPAAFEQELVHRLTREAHYRLGCRYIDLDRLQAMSRPDPFQGNKTAQAAAEALGADLLLLVTLSRDPKDKQIRTQSRLVSLTRRVTPVPEFGPEFAPGSRPRFRPKASLRQPRLPTDSPATVATSHQDSDLGPDPDPDPDPDSNSGRAVAERMAPKLFGAPSPSDSMRWHDPRAAGMFVPPGVSPKAAIITWPAEARIQWSGKLDAPRLGPGTLQVSAPGFISFVRDIVIKPRTTIYVNLEQQTGTVAVQIPPEYPEAWLEIDDDIARPLPRSLVLGTGAHRARVRIYGKIVANYNFELKAHEELIWQMEQQPTYPVAIKASRVHSPYFTFKNVAAEAFIEGTAVGRTPLTLRLPPGQHELKLSVLGAESKKTFVTVPSANRPAVDLTMDLSTKAGQAFLARHPTEARMQCERWAHRSGMTEGQFDLTGPLIELVPIFRPFMIFLPWRAQEEAPRGNSVAHGGSWWWQAQAWLIESALLAGVVMIAKDYDRSLGLKIATAAYFATPLLDSMWIRTILPARNRTRCLELLEASQRVLRTSSLSGPAL